MRITKIKPTLMKSSFAIVFLDDLIRLTKEEVEKLGKDFFWLQYARRTGNGYHFFPNRDRQWIILERISQKLAKEYPEIRYGEIVDSLSILVNTTIKDYLKITQRNIIFTRKINKIY